IIWKEFYVKKYAMARRLKDPETGEIVEFRGTDFADVYLDTSIDVGASSQWSEALTVEVLDNLLEKQVINPVQYLERYPKNIIPEQDKLIEELKEQMQVEEQNQQYEQMAQFFEQLPPE